MLIRRTIYVAAAAVVGALILAQSAKAQDEPDVRAVVEDTIAEPAPGGINTVLVFTNLGRQAGKVSMRAIDDNGDPAGRAELELPANGLAAIAVSSIVADSSGSPFVGKVMAVATGRAAATALLVGAGPVTDLPVLRRERRVRLASSTDANVRRHRVTDLTFPVAASSY